MRPTFAFVIIVLCALATAAQNDACPIMQDRAQANILAHCVDQADGTLCLGHQTVTPVYRDSGGVSRPFRHPGDTIPIAGIDWLSVSSEAKTWGAIRALFPAFPPEGLEAWTSALVAIGNVALFLPPLVPPPAPLAEVQVTAPRGAYLRTAPDLDAEIITPLPVRSKLLAFGVSPGPAWLRAYHVPAGPGWISAAVVTEPAVDLPLLRHQPEAIPLWLPWQIFDFRSGIDDMPCAGSLESGILLGTPKYIAPRHFEINGIGLDISGAAWLQAQVSSGMLLHVIDGAATVSTPEGAVFVNRGFETSVPLAQATNGAIVPSAAPTAPQPYDYHALINLPIHLMIYETRVSLDVNAVVSPVPVGGGNPLESVSAADDCTITAHLEGANIRARPDPEAPIIAVMAYRESAAPVERGIGNDRQPWWKLGNSIWVRGDATVSAGNCKAVPFVLSGKLSPHKIVSISG